MNAPASTPALTDVQIIDGALTMLLDHIIALDLGPRRELPPGAGPMTIGQMSERYRWDQQTTEAERFMLKIMDDPVREALTHALRQCGKRLYEIGGLDAMHEACGRQEDLSNGGRRVSILDKRWDGIGTANGRVGWVA